MYVAATDVPLDQWEFYAVIDDNPDPDMADDREICCPSSTDGTSACCGS